jgi:tellurite methyltransferase
MPDWNERYRSGRHSFHEPFRLLVEQEAAMAEATGGRGVAVDLASGPGRHSLFLAERGWHVLALDSSTVALELLQQQARARGLSVETRPDDLEADG